MTSAMNQGSVLIWCVGSDTENLRYGVEEAEIHLQKDSVTLDSD